jgi:hypothetical protein
MVIAGLIGANVGSNPTWSTTPKLSPYPVVSPILAYATGFVTPQFRIEQLGRKSCPPVSSRRACRRLDRRQALAPCPSCPIFRRRLHGCKLG